MTSRGACPAFLLVVALVLSLAVSPAQASPGAPDHSRHHAVDLVWVAAALLVLCGQAILGGRRGARGWVLSLALVVGLFGVESAIHSVHHLGDPEGAESCAVFSAAQSVLLVGAQSPDVGEPIWRPESRSFADPVRARRLQILRFDAGRSPPALPSA